jgi:hypothetical protein
MLLFFQKNFDLLISLKLQAEGREFAKVLRTLEQDGKVRTIQIQIGKNM